MRTLSFFLASMFSLSASAQVLDSLAIFGTSFDVDLYGNIFVLDQESSLFFVYNPEGKRRVTQLGGHGWGTEQFDSPSGVWARNGMDIFVADYGNHRIQRYDRTLSFVNTLYTREDVDQEKRFGYPSDIALSRQGDLFICDSENERLLKVRRSTQAELSFGGYDAGQGRLVEPLQIEIGANDLLYVLDKGGRVVVFDVFGNYLRDLGKGLFRNPSSIFADDNQILVLDGDLLYRFDRNERPSSPVSIQNLVGGRFGTSEIRSMVSSRGVLFLLTSRGMFLVQLAPMNTGNLRK